ncbi:MAG TPA: hypothetical protein VLA37_10670, partial [Sphingomonadaceae bacterium]|nr:hypothetical protein [Sphingomonadaceae bacterium]
LQEAASRPRGRKPGSRTQGASGSRAPLTGKLFDETGDRLTPTHANKAGRRLRYYVSRRLLDGRAPADPTGWRLPAGEVEDAVTTAVTAHLGRLIREPWLLFPSGRTTVNALARLPDQFDQKLGRLTREHLMAMLEEIRIAPGTLLLSLKIDELADAMALSPETIAPEALAVPVPFRLRRRGHEARIVTGERRPARDPVLSKALALAHKWQRDLLAGTPLGEVARRAGIAEAQLRTRLPLAYLAPKIQQAILDGTQPPELCLERIVRRGVPLDWDEQARRFGFSDEAALP